MGTYQSKFTGAEIDANIEKIKNTTVPTKTSQLTNDSGFITKAPTKTSELTNDSGFITKAPTKTSELTNDSGFATESYVEQEIATFDFIKVVDSLPETGLENRIYFVPKTDAETQDLFDEYSWINGKWEWITTKQLEVDLTTKQDTLVSGENIKTINGTSILGSGNLVIEGGSGGASGVPTKTVLWEGDLNAINSHVTLSDNLENYDYLIIDPYYLVAISSVNTKRAFPSVLLPTGEIKNNYGGVKRFLLGMYNSGSTSAAEDICHVFGMSNNSTDFYLTGITKGGSIRGGGITSIVGIKCISAENVATTDYVDGLVGDIETLLQEV